MTNLMNTSCYTQNQEIIKSYVISRYSEGKDKPVGLFVPTDDHHSNTMFAFSDQAEIIAIRYDERHEKIIEYDCQFDFFNLKNYSKYHEEYLTDECY